MASWLCWKLALKLMVLALWLSPSTEGLPYWAIKEAVRKYMGGPGVKKL